MGSIIACLENKLTAVKSILKISSFEKLSVLFNTMRQSSLPARLGRFGFVIINIKGILLKLKKIFSPEMEEKKMFGLLEY